LQLQVVAPVELAEPSGHAVHAAAAGEALYVLAKQAGGRTPPTVPRLRGEAAASAPPHDGHGRPRRVAHAQSLPEML